MKKNLRLIQIENYNIHVFLNSLIFIRHARSIVFESGVGQTHPNNLDKQTNKKDNFSMLRVCPYCIFASHISCCNKKDVHIMLITDDL